MNHARSRSQGNQKAFNAFATDTYRYVRGDTPEGLPPVDDGYRAAVLIGALLQSHQTGARVETPSVSHPSP